MWLRDKAPNIGSLASVVVLCGTYLVLSGPASVPPSSGLVPPVSSVAPTTSATTTTFAGPEPSSSTRPGRQPFSGMQSTTTATGTDGRPDGPGVPSSRRSSPPPATPGPTSEPEPPSSATATSRPTSTTSTPGLCVLNAAHIPVKIPCRSTAAIRAIIEAAGYEITLEGDVIVAISDD